MLGKLCSAARRQLVHFRCQAGRYARLVWDRRAAQQDGIGHARCASLGGFLQLGKCGRRGHANGNGRGWKSPHEVAHRFSEDSLSEQGKG
jgi:hypothetical protein